MNYENIHATRDPAMRSLRIDQGYRAIVLKPDRGDVHMPLWADKHDDAYAWAGRHECSIHPEPLWTRALRNDLMVALNGNPLLGRVQATGESDSIADYLRKHVGQRSGTVRASS